jgi:hypothetical protein
MRGRRWRRSRYVDDGRPTGGARAAARARDMRGARVPFMSRRGLATRRPTVVAIAAHRPPTRPLTPGGPLPAGPAVAVHHATPDARTRASGPARSNRRASGRQGSGVAESPPEPARKLAGLPFVTAVLAHSVRCVEADRASAQHELVAAGSLFELMCWWPVDDRHGVLGAAGRAGRAFHAMFVARSIASLTSAAARQTRRSNSLPHVQRDTARAGSATPNRRVSEPRSASSAQLPAP